MRASDGDVFFPRYATKGSLVKAISDFEIALESSPAHRNAKKYLCQTLVERGGQ